MSLFSPAPILGALTLAFACAAPVSGAPADSGPPAPPAPMLDLAYGIDEVAVADPATLPGEAEEASLDRVPEPGTVVMIAATGVVALLLRIRKRRW